MNRELPKIEHVLFISGPSAGGKSTLISQLTAGLLSPAIMRHLPQGTRNWQHVDGNDILKRDIALEDALPSERNIPGVIIHYDFVHIVRVGFGQDYFEDPIFKIFSHCNQVTFCDVRPSAERLLQQFLHRQHEQLSRKGKLRVLWRRAVRSPLKKFLLWSRGKHHFIKDEIYRDADWMKSCYDAWDAFLGRACAAHGQVKLIRVEPVGSTFDDIAFRLIETVP